jgi:hypothetical protein
MRGFFVGRLGVARRTRGDRRSSRPTGQPRRAASASAPRDERAQRARRGDRPLHSAAGVPQTRRARAARRSGSEGAGSHAASPPHRNAPATATAVARLGSVQRLSATRCPVAAARGELPALDWGAASRRPHRGPASSAVTRSALARHHAHSARTQPARVACSCSDGDRASRELRMAPRPARVSCVHSSHAGCRGECRHKNARRAECRSPAHW